MLPLFNPPSPGADPIQAEGFPGQLACGRCVCVPKYWEVLAGGVNNPSTYAGIYLGRTVLSRDLSGQTYSALAPCRWQSPFFNFTPLGGPGFAANLWQLRFDSAADALAGSPVGRWYLIATGVPAIGAAPADVVVYSQLHNTFDPVAGVIPQFFNCLKPNLFTLSPELGSGGIPGLPTTLTVQPFWP